MRYWLIAVSFLLICSLAACSLLKAEGAMLEEAMKDSQMEFEIKIIVKPGRGAQ